MSPLILLTLGRSELMMVFVGAILLYEKWGVRLAVYLYDMGVIRWGVFYSGVWSAASVFL